MHFLERCAAQAHRRVSSIHPEALERLARYRWPGNVRELQNVLERAFILAEDGRPIRAEHLPLDPPEEAAETNGLAAGLREAERQCIVEALRACNGNRSLAARRLGIGRRTLYDKLVRLGISLAQEV
jgi:two-component system response regulator HydG